MVLDRNGHNDPYRASGMFSNNELKGMKNYELVQIRSEGSSLQKDIQEVWVKTGTIANYLELSYTYVCSMLNGKFRMRRT